MEHKIEIERATENEAKHEIEIENGTKRGTNRETNAIGGINVVNNVSYIYIHIYKLTFVVLGMCSFF